MHRPHHARWLALVLLAAGCRGGPPHPYPQDVVENFVTSCRTHTEERVCRCAIDRIQRRYSLDEFRAFEDRMGRGEVVKELIDTVSDCVQR
jgi:hypothetical protein